MNENPFLHYIKVFTCVLVTTYNELPRVSSIQNLVLGLPEGRPGTVKALFQNSVACNKKGNLGNGGPQRVWAKYRFLAKSELSS